ncbi:IS3 family transposase [Rhizobium mongolense]
MFGVEDRSLALCLQGQARRAGRTLKIKDICQTRVRYGYRRVHILLNRDGRPVNPKRIYRLYKEMDLQRNKDSQAPRQREASGGSHGSVPFQPNGLCS